MCLGVRSCFVYYLLLIELISIRQQVKVSVKHYQLDSPNFCFKGCGQFWANLCHRYIANRKVLYVLLLLAQILLLKRLKKIYDQILQKIQPFKCIDIQLCQNVKSNITTSHIRFKLNFFDHISVYLDSVLTTLNIECQPRSEFAPDAQCNYRPKTSSELLPDLYRLRRNCQFKPRKSQLKHHICFFFYQFPPDETLSIVRYIKLILTFSYKEEFLVVVQVTISHMSPSKVKLILIMQYGSGFWSLLLLLF